MKLKTINARAKAIIRTRFPMHKHITQVWIKSMIDKDGVERIFGTTGLCLSDTTVEGLMKEQPDAYFRATAVSLNIAYLLSDFECFANAFIINVKPQELL